MNTSEKQRVADKKYYEGHREECREYSAKYREEHPEWVEGVRREQARKGGKYYNMALVAQRSGIRGARSIVRSRDRRQWGKYKNIIAPLSQIHHEWIPGTADCRGIALVEADQHIRGYIDVIEVLNGEITMSTEEEVRGDMTTW